MSSTSRIDIRLTEEEKEQLKQQASKLNLTVSEYFRLIIALDCATGIINNLTEWGKINDRKTDM